MPFPILAFLLLGGGVAAVALSGSKPTDKVKFKAPNAFKRLPGEPAPDSIVIEGSTELVANKHPRQSKVGSGDPDDPKRYDIENADSVVVEIELLDLVDGDVVELDTTITIEGPPQTPTPVLRNTWLCPDDYCWSKRIVREYTMGRYKTTSKGLYSEGDPTDQPLRCPAKFVPCTGFPGIGMGAEPKTAKLVAHGSKVFLAVQLDSRAIGWRGTVRYRAVATFQS